MTKFIFTPQGRGFVQLIKDLIETKKVDLGSIGIQFAQYFLMSLTLPVNPEELTITTSSDNKTTEVVGLGEIIIPKGTKLSRLTIESFFPKVSSTVFAKLSGDRLPPYVVQSITSDLLGFSSENYFTYFKLLQMLRVPLRLTIVDLNKAHITMLVVIDSIERKNVAADDDLYYTMDLVEYTDGFMIPIVNQVISSVGSAVTGAAVNIVDSNNRIKTDFAAGDTVIASGKYWYDSFGAKPFGTFNNFRGKISHVATNKNATYKYHITTPDGGWRGWVKADQLKGAD